ncbi:MAG: hypothetical protein ABI477_19630 [Chryseolinea sp.]
MKKLLFLIILISGASPSTFGQKKKIPASQIPATQAPTRQSTSGEVKNDTLKKFQPRSLYLIARNYGDSVVLRWTPREPIYWRAANRSGYIIRRYVVEGNKPSGKKTGTVLTPQPIKPWTPEIWKARIKPGDTLSLVAAQILYGKTVSTADPKKGVSMQEAMNATNDLQNRHAYAILLADQSGFVANGLGMRFVDRTVEKGKTYAYAIYALVDAKQVRSDTAATVINTTVILPAPEMPEVMVEQLDHAVKFSWDRKRADMFFSTYFLERSTDQGKTFKRVNHQAFVQPLRDDQNELIPPPITYVDSLPSNYRPYIYRIYGITPFGEAGKPTKNLPVMGRDKISPSAPVQVTAEHIKGSHVRLRWQKKSNEPDFAGFMVGKSPNVNGPFVPLNLKLLPKTATEFLDTEALASGTNYYVIAALDTANNAGLSLPAYVIMKDSLPPGKPTGLTGKIDTTGIVKLHWKLGKELDLYGYLVYYANAKDHAFTPISTDFVADSTFTDSVSLRTLTEKIYYRIVAFDKNRNPSKSSDILELKKPDKNPPVAAVFTGFQVTDTTVVMNWAPSSSADLTSQLLYRRVINGTDSAWIEYARLDKGVKDFTDRKVKKLTRYEYSIVAIDDAGLRSQKSFPLSVRVYDSGVRKKIEGFSANKSADGKAIVLSWNYKVKDEFRFVVYRSFNKGDLLTYKSVAASDASFSDKNVQTGEYEYAIKAVYQDGGESPLSKPVKIEYRAK